MIYWAILASFALPFLATLAVLATIRPYGSFQRMLAAGIPMRDFFRIMMDRVQSDWRISFYVVPCAAFNVLWPWCTLAALLLYRASLKQARIKTGHVLRCVIYSQTPALVIIPLAMLLLWIAVPRLTPTLLFSIVPGGALWALVPCLLLLSWRLAIAFRLYLRFPHAISAVVASQIIVGLTLFKAYLVWLGY